MGEAFEASRVAEVTDANVHWSSTLQVQQTKSKPRKQNSKWANWNEKKKKIIGIEIEIEIWDRRGRIFDLIGIGIANEEHLERIAEHDSSVIPLVDARLHDLHVFLPHCHLLSFALGHAKNPNAFFFWLAGVGRWWMMIALFCSLRSKFELGSVLPDIGIFR